MKFETKVIHAGQEPDPRTGAVMTPIYATSTYAQSSPGEHQGFDYARTRNPTRDALEACLAELESGTRGFAFASGMAAIGTVLELLEACDAFRRPERFRELLVACEADHRGRGGFRERPYPQGDLLRQAQEKAMTVALSEADRSGLAGEKIGELLRRRRLAALKAVS